MNDISQKLADSLEQLQQLQESGAVAVQSRQLSRVHRERLLKHGFIREVIRGWYIPTMPGASHLNNQLACTSAIEPYLSNYSCARLKAIINLLPFYTTPPFLMSS